MPALALLALLRRFWPYALGGAALIGAYLWVDHRGYQRGFHKRDPEVAALQQTIADVRLKTAQAQADDAAHAQTIAATDNQIAKETNDALESQLADARAAAARHADRLRAETAIHPGSGRTSDMPAAAGPAGGPDGARQAAVVDDASACGEAVVKATGWQEWYKSVAAVPGRE